MDRVDLPTLLAWGALLLPLTVAAQPLQIFGGDEDAEKKESVEFEVKLPPMPKTENLVPFEASAANTNNFFIDATSILIGADGIVRYTMVVKSPSGAENISYEGMRCETTEQKTYAYGRRDGTWSNARAPAWKKIVYKDINRQHAVLYSHYFCPDGEPIRSAKDAIQRFKYGVPYGQPPRSSNR
ncbi:MAG: CNP1-like family protein [Betaproteobacteria bacterium]